MIMPPSICGGRILLGYDVVEFMEFILHRPLHIVITQDQNGVMPYAMQCIKWNTYKLPTPSKVIATCSFLLSLCNYHADIVQRNK